MITVVEVAINNNKNRLDHMTCMQQAERMGSLSLHLTLPILLGKIQESMLSFLILW